MVASLVDRNPVVSPDALIDEMVPPPTFDEVSFDSYIPDPNEPTQSQAVDAARDFVTRARKVRGGKRGLFSRNKQQQGVGLYLDGGFGVGKTHLLASIYHAMPEPKSFATFVEVTHLVGALGFMQAVERLSDHSVLCIDEFELDDPGDTMLISRLLAELTEQGVSIAATSNTLPGQLGEGRFAAQDFLREIRKLASVFDTIRVDGPDYRHRDLPPAPDPRSDAETLAVAPLSIAHMLRENLFGEQTVVLTSATLALGGRFDAMAAQWGMPSGTYDTLDAGTPFDPAKSGILYTAKHLPAPGRDGLSKESIEEIYELIMAAGGRTLGLFSSRRAAEEAAAALKPRIPFDLFVQGEDSIGALVEKFSQKENSCLFGTLTLWQGVDVPGPACSLVIIDRIPFPRPDDPLMQARAQAADAAGRSGFMEVSANHAALLMAQGAGRLLRHVTDRGVVAVLDSRLATAGYGGYLLASMPPFWRTTDPDVVRAALGRLAAVPLR